MPAQLPTPPSAPENPGTMDRARLLIVVFTVVIGLGIASIPLINSFLATPATTSSLNSVNTDSAANQGEAAVPDSSQEAAAPTFTSSISVPCAPADTAASGEHTTVAPGAELADIRLPCLTDNGTTSTSSLAQLWAGKPTIVNVWAWWCVPCRKELPVVAELANNNPQWNVVGVHLDPQPQAGLDFLEKLGISTLPSFQDSKHTFDAATRIPKVVPVTLVYRADGTRAELFVRTFDNTQELQQLVTAALHKK